MSGNGPGALSGPPGPPPAPPFKTVLLWFRRDVRVSDNPALIAAVQAATNVVRDPAAQVFIFAHQQAFACSKVILISYRSWNVCARTQRLQPFPVEQLQVYLSRVERDLALQMQDMCSLTASRGSSHTRPSMIGLKIIFWHCSACHGRTAYSCSCSLTC